MKPRHGVHNRESRQFPTRRLFPLPQRLIMQVIHPRCGRLTPQANPFHASSGYPFKYRGGCGSSLEWGDGCLNPAFQTVQ